MASVKSQARLVFLTQRWVLSAEATLYWKATSTGSFH